jgi:hypothetical protein
LLELQNKIYATKILWDNDVLTCSEVERDPPGSSAGPGLMLSPAAKQPTNDVNVEDEGQRMVLSEHRRKGRLTRSRQSVDEN